MDKSVADFIANRAYKLYPRDHSGYEIVKANSYISGAMWQYEIAKIAYEEVLAKYGLDVSANNFEEKILNIANERNK